MAGQDAFIHETTRARINTPQGQDKTLFVNSAVARNPDDVNARFLIKHPDGTFEPIVGAPASGYQVDINGVFADGVITLTATPSFGLPADYTYVWSLESLNMVNANPDLGAAVDNTLEVSNDDVATAEGMIKVISTHIATGAIAEAYFWVALDGTPA